MSSHPNRVPRIIIRRHDHDCWLWVCARNNSVCWHGYLDTHAEALAAALDHCRTKEAS